MYILIYIYMYMRAPPSEIYLEALFKQRASIASPPSSTSAASSSPSLHHPPPPRHGACSPLRGRSEQDCEGAGEGARTRGTCSNHGDDEEPAVEQADILLPTIIVILFNVVVVVVTIIVVVIIVVIIIIAIIVFIIVNFTVIASRKSDVDVPKFLPAHY